MSIGLREGNKGDGGFIIRKGVHVSKRELEALCLVADGKDNKTGAELMQVTVNTFRNHIQNVMEKLGARNRANAIVKAVENEMLFIGRDRGMIGWRYNDYILCAMCGRAFIRDKIIFGETEKVIINGVECESPEKRICPYEDCKSDFALFVEWSFVLSKRPEYPKIPEHGKEYDYEVSWLYEQW
ncbi:response regulator transcription factor [Chloroflexota bacterium]